VIYFHAVEPMEVHDLCAILVNLPIRRENPLPNQFYWLNVLKELEEEDASHYWTVEQCM
jgi:hypothetical protein